MMSRSWFWPLAIVGLSLTLRLAYALEFAGEPVGWLPWGDEGAYWERALEIRQGGWLPGQPFYQDPLLPYLLAGWMSLFGSDVARLRVVLAVVGALTPLVIYGAGRRGLGRAEGVMAGLASAVYGPLIFTDALLEKEGPGALLAAIGLLLTAELATRGPRARPGLAVASGFAWGLLVLLRSNALIVGPVGAAWAGCLPGEVGRRRGWLAFGFLLGFGLPIAPVVAINAVVGRPPEFLLTTWQAGANFYIGNGPEATGTYEAPAFVEANASSEAGDFRAEAERRAGRSLTPGEVSRFWLGEGLKRWRDAPGRSLALFGRKLGLLGHDLEIPDNQDIAFLRVIAPALSLGFLSFGWVAPWAALGIGRVPRTAFWWFLTLSTVAGLSSTALFFVVGRYRIPWVPGLLLLAAAGLVDLARRLRQRRWRELATPIVLLMAPAAVLAWRPIDDPAPDRWGHGLIVLALADLGANRLDRAIDALDDARALGPGSAERVESLLTGGLVRDRLALLVKTHLGAEILTGAPTDRRRELRHARWLRQFPDRRSESRLLLDRALQADPGDFLAHRELGAWWLGNLGDPSARRLAAGELSRATGDPSAAVTLALLSGDRRRLPGRWPGVDPAPDRLRLARAILATRSARAGLRSLAASPR